MPFPPEAYIIGAQKAGTTSLAAVLDAQPGILLSNPKEPEFFTRQFGRGLDWYRSCFHGDAEQVLVDADTGYSAAPTELFPLSAREPSDPLHGAAKRIADLSPHARFIYMVRDPVARTYSAYWHNVRAGWESRPFRRAIAEDPVYHRISDYAGQIRNYLLYFPPERFLVVSFESFIEDPVNVAGACCRHLGTQFTGVPADDNGGHRNKSFQFRGAGRILQSVAGTNRNLEWLVKVGREIIPRPLQAAVQRWLIRDIPRISDADRSELSTLYAGWNEALASIDGLRWISTAPTEGAVSDRPRKPSG